MEDEGCGVGAGVGGWEGATTTSTFVLICLSQGLSFHENSNISHKSHGLKRPRINGICFHF